MNRASAILFGVALTVEILLFAALNLFDDWTLQGMPIKFVGAAFLCGAAYLAAVSKFPPMGGFAVANKIDIRKQVLLFWGVALFLRLIALPLVPADDLIRNQWEGKIQRAGFNPYEIAPSDSKLDQLRHDFPEAAKINHPDVRATDPPGAQLMFRFLVGLSDRPLLYKILFAIADLAVAAVLLRLIGGENRYRDAAWYAWNPLVAYAFAGAAHFDSLTVLALTAAILALVRTCPERQSNGSTSESDVVRGWLWTLAAALFLGIALSLNVMAASLFLLFLFALRWRAVVLAIAILIPILLGIQFDLSKVWDGLGQVAQFSRLNDLFWWLAETFWDNPHQRNYHYCPILIAVIIGVSFLFLRDWKRGMLWALGTALVLSPVLHPWYVIWILPLATWRRAYAWHVLSVTLFAYYLFWDERLFRLPWHAEPWMRALTIAPVLASLIMLAAQKRSTTAAS